MEYESQLPVAKYRFSVLARDKLARIVAQKESGNLRGSKLKRHVGKLDSYRLKTPCTFTMYDFEQHSSDSDVWLSEPFYTAPQGYKMNLTVYANGTRDGADTHVSVFLQLIPGEFDDRLLWPFRGRFVVKLLDIDETDEGEDIQRVIAFNSQTPPDVTRKPTYRYYENREWGWQKFAAQRDISPQYSYPSWRDHPVYIDPEEDCACFRVTKK